jgi:hypothetical protein
MAIRLDDITTDITLEIDEDVISIADFQKATDSFLGLVKELSRAVSGNADAASWQVKVYKGSVGVGVAPLSSGLDSLRIRNVMVSGLRALADGIRPGEFTDKAIEHSKSLASLFRKSNVDPNVRIWSQREESVRVGRSVAAGAEKLLAAVYEEDGSVDGILEKVDGHGKLQLVIYDVLNNHAVKCEFANEQLPQALASFQQRVEVVGRVRYRRDGMPVSIRATRIINYPSKPDIPTLTQMRALLSGSAST